ncbi:DUF6275 family protein [Liquorilactobacillus mali]|uniref:DUF6275 family protein n=1 Tax=Liquorilactobacillus mali TaxID=1618 RepID=UPI0002491960|nr:DUF6275 family protein [Liquorilactobacillus mali]
MDSQKFIKACKRLVVSYTNEHLDITNQTLVGESDVYVVWSSKTLQNSKACLSTRLLDEMYYEITYNGDRKELYFDAYKKFENRKIDVDFEED